MLIRYLCRSVLGEINCCHRLVLGMSRLASFKGPSTPSSSPVAKQQPKSPGSPSRPIESTYHRKTRTALQELRAITETWDDLVLIDGLKAARSLVDARTDLEWV